MSNGTETPVPRRTPIWVKALLIASLAINVAVIGVVAGYKMKDGEKARGESRQISWIVRLVPEHRRDFTKAHFAEGRRELAATMLDRTEQMERILVAVRATPFVAAELRAALEVRRENTVQRRVVIHERLVTLLEQFEPAERQVFADNLEARLARMRARRAPALSVSGSNN